MKAVRPSPSTLAEAVDRRNELLLEKSQVEIAVQRWTGHARSEAVLRCNAINAELSSLKTAIQRLSVAEKHAMDKFDVVTDGTERMRRLKEAYGGVWEYVKFLEREVADLRAENERLKESGGEDTSVDF